MSCLNYYSLRLKLQFQIFHAKILWQQLFHMFLTGRAKIENKFDKDKLQNYSLGTTSIFINCACYISLPFIRWITYIQLWNYYTVMNLRDWGIQWIWWPIQMRTIFHTTSLVKKWNLFIIYGKQLQILFQKKLFWYNYFCGLKRNPVILKCHLKLGFIYVVSALAA